MPVLGRSVKNQGRRAALWRCSRRAADLTGGLRKIRVGKFIANGQAQLVDRAALLAGSFAECIHPLAGVKAGYRSLSAVAARRRMERPAKGLVDRAVNADC